MSKKSQINLPILSQDASLVRYLDDIQKFPMLSESEEVELARKWHKEQDITAAQKLVTSHLRYVAKIAMQYRGYGLPMVDIISEGNIGLMKAVKKFDPEKGFRLSSYSGWWIKATIQDYILKSWSLVKIGTSAAKKKLFFNLKKVQNKLMHIHNGDVPANQDALIAAELNLPESEVNEMSARMSGDISLNTKVINNDEESSEIIDITAEPSESHELTVIENHDYENKKTKFLKALSKLNEREQEIIYARRIGQPAATLDKLSEKYGVSSERIRQIEQKAINKLKKFVLED